MLELDRTHLGFKIKTVYFADRPYDVDGVDWLDFIHVREKLNVPGFERQDWSNAIVNLAEGPDRLWEKMASKCRSDIRKAEKEGIVTQINGDFQTFIELNNGFRKAKNLAPNYQHILHPPLPEYCTLFTAEYGGEMVGGILFVHDENEMQGLLAASKRLEVKKEETASIARANRLLWWEAAKWGAENGISILDMGNCPVAGTDPEREGLSEFKRRFGAEPTPSYVYRKLYTRRIRLARKCTGIVRFLKGSDPPAQPISVKIT